MPTPLPASSDDEVVELNVRFGGTAGLRFDVRRELAEQVELIRPWLEKAHGGFSMPARCFATGLYRD